MNLDRMVSLVCRVLFLVTSVCLLLAIAEKFANLNGQTLTRSYTPERLLEITIALAVLVIVLLLRQIRERLPRSG